MTEAGSVDSDLATDALDTASRLRNIYCMLTEAECTQAEAKLTAHFGRRPPIREVAWRAANQKLLGLTRQKDWQGLSSLYDAMARQLYDDGRDHFELARASVHYKLLSLQRVCSEVELVSGFASNHCEHECGHCSAEKTVLPIALALETMPIPRKDCGYHLDNKHHARQSGWCVCSFSPKQESTGTR